MWCDNMHNNKYTFITDGSTEIQEVKKSLSWQFLLQGEGVRLLAHLSMMMAWVPQVTAWEAEGWHIPY